MILTDKAKTEFLKWYGTSSEYFTITLKDIEQHANIIEWFDSVGIYVSVYFKYIWRVEIRDSETNLLSTLDYNVFDTRQEATKQAIIKANEIYNGL